MVCVSISDCGSHGQTDSEQRDALKAVHRQSSIAGAFTDTIEQLPAAAITAAGIVIPGMSGSATMTTRQRLAVNITLPITGWGSPCTLAEMLSCQRPAMASSVLNAYTPGSGLGSGVKGESIVAMPSGA